VWKSVKSFTLLGKRWKFRNVPPSKCIQVENGKIKKLDGYVKHDKQIVAISTGVEGCDRLETVIHEALHAAFPWMREWIILAAAEEIARLLWRLGYRNIDELDLDVKR